MKETTEEVKRRHGRAMMELIFGVKDNNYFDKLGRKLEMMRRAPTPEYGPGTELKLLLESLGFISGSNCRCKARMEEMNKWGIQGSKDKRDEIVGWLRDEQTRKGWKDKLKAAALAVTTGIVSKINFTDIAGSLFDEALRRTEEKAQNL